MQPDVICRAEDLPFADGAFDLVVSRIAPHHFEDVAAAVAEMARVCNDLVVVEDTLYVSEEVEEAEKLRDPTHVRSYSRGGVAGAARGRRPRDRAGRGVREAASARAVARPLGDAPEDDRPRVKELLADQIEGDEYVDTKLVIKRARKRVVAIIVDQETKLVVQGLTGSEGSFHGLRNKRYGTQVVAGVTPGKGGQDVEGIPVFDTVADAVAETGANTTMVFVPARFAADAIYEAVDAGHRDRDLHRRGPARARDAPDLHLHPAEGRDDARPELPGRALAGQGERRDHPGRDLRRGERSASSRARAR